MNQCDGCRAGHEVVTKYGSKAHVNERGYMYMSCQSHRYVQEETPEQRAKRELGFPIEGVEP